MKKRGRTILTAVIMLVLILGLAGVNQMRRKETFQPETTGPAANEAGRIWTFQFPDGDIVYYIEEDSFAEMGESWAWDGYEMGGLEVTVQNASYLNSVDQYDQALMKPAVESECVYPELKKLMLIQLKLNNITEKELNPEPWSLVSLMTVTETKIERELAWPYASVIGVRQADGMFLPVEDGYSATIGPGESLEIECVMVMDEADYVGMDGEFLLCFGESPNMEICRFIPLGIDVPSYDPERLGLTEVADASGNSKLMSNKSLYYSNKKRSDGLGDMELVVPGIQVSSSIASGLYGEFELKCESVSTEWVEDTEQLPDGFQNNRFLESIREVYEAEGISRDLGFLLITVKFGYSTSSLNCFQDLGLRSFSLLMEGDYEKETDEYHLSYYGDADAYEVTEMEGNVIYKQSTPERSVLRFDFNRDGDSAVVQYVYVMYKPVKQSLFLLYEWGWWQNQEKDSVVYLDEDELNRSFLIQID